MTVFARASTETCAHLTTTSSAHLSIQMVAQAKASAGFEIPACALQFHFETSTSPNFSSGALFTGPTPRERDLLVSHSNLVNQSDTWCPCSISLSSLIRAPADFKPAAFSDAATPKTTFSVRGELALGVLGVSIRFCAETPLQLLHCHLASFAVLGHRHRHLEGAHLVRLLRVHPLRPFSLVAVIALRCFA